MDWQPIETAPTDGTVVLLLHGGEAYCGWWAATGEWQFIDSTDEHISGCCDGEAKGLIEPNAFIEQVNRKLRWMPLPPPPTLNK